MKKQAELKWASEVRAPTQRAAAPDQVDVDSLCESTYDQAMAALDIQLSDLERTAKKEGDNGISFYKALDELGKNLHTHITRTILAEGKFLAPTVDMKTYEIKTLKHDADELIPSFEAIGMTVDEIKFARFKIKQIIDAAVAPHRQESRQPTG